MGHSSANLKQAVPFLMVTNMEASLEYYVEGLGFEIKIDWKPKGRIEWCWLERGGAALMLQEYRQDFVPREKLGQGVSLCFICEDALLLYREFIHKGLSPSEPFVGNSMWVTSLKDPDGYRLEFESHTDVPEETSYSEWAHAV
jgi:lactoylglutathione lyase